MKVLLVLTARTIGGAELYIQRLVAVLQARCTFTVVLPDHPHLAHFCRELQLLAAIRRFNFDRAFHLPAVLPQLQQLADEHDLVHLNSNHPGSRLGIACGFALGARRTPLVCVEHRVTPIADIRVPRAIAPVLPILFRWSRRGAAQIVAVSAENARRLTEHYRLLRQRVCIVRGGVALEAYTAFDSQAGASVRAELGLALDQRLIIVVARLSPNKGHRFLIEAAPAILAQYPKVHFVFVGSADNDEALRDQIARLGLQSKFSLLGFRADVPRLLMASDVFVLPSLGEGFAMAIPEALAAGLPVVATLIGGVEEIETITGRQPELRFVPPAAPEPLAQAICALLHLGLEEREQWRLKARTLAHHFSAQTMAQQMFEVYQKAKA